VYSQLYKDRKTKRIITFIGGSGKKQQKVSQTGGREKRLGVAAGRAGKKEVRSRHEELRGSRSLSAALRIVEKRRRNRRKKLRSNGKAKNHHLLKNIHKRLNRGGSAPSADRFPWQGRRVLAHWEGEGEKFGKNSGIVGRSLNACEGSTVVSIGLHKSI